MERVVEKRQWQFSLWYLLIIFWIIILLQSIFFTSHPVDIAYSDFINLLKADKLERVTLSEESINAHIKASGLQGLLPEDKLNALEQYGGRAAEFVIFGHFSTGSADDLAKATDIARSMVMRYGMDAQLGPVTYESERQTYLEIPMAKHGEREFSEDTARQIDAAVRKIIQTAFDDTVDIIKKRIQILEKGATLLLQKETLNEEELMELHKENDHVHYSGS